jgi:hypothetical protein
MGQPLRNHPRTIGTACAHWGYCDSLHSRPDNGSPRHGPQEIATQAPGHDLGDPRRSLAEDRAHPHGILAKEAHRASRRPLANHAQRHPLPDAERLPVGAITGQVRPQEHRPRLVPTLGPGRYLREDLGGPGRRVRRTRRRAVAVAIGRRDAGQGPVRGGKRRAEIPPIAANRAPRRACWSTATVAHSAW